MLVGAVSAAVANVELTVARDGVTVRTGWNRSQETRAASVDPATAAELQRVTARMRELETRIASLGTAPVSTQTASAQGRMSDAEMIKTVRALIDQSEERQQGVLARQILQVSRDVETARRTDFDRLRRGIQQVEGTAFEAVQRQRAFEEHVIRVGLQR
jgi:hypothetical protein